MERLKKNDNKRGKDSTKGSGRMKRNRVEEAQKYLAARGITMSETAIVDAALDIVCSQDLLYRYCLSTHLRRKKVDGE